MVQERQRQRAIDEGRRNVHAWVRGTLVSTDEPVSALGGWHRARYNCFRAACFTSADFPHAAVVGAERAYFDDTGAAWVRDVRLELMRRPARLPPTIIPRLRAAVLSGF